jgi:general secretion pathway protein F
LQLSSARTCAALGTLLESGVPLLGALQLCADASTDGAVATRIGKVREDVTRGERLGESVRRHEALSPLALRLVDFGERSGRLAGFLAQAARLEAAAAQRTIQRAVTMLEPALILGLGLAVAFVAAALLQAVYSVRPTGI